MIDLDALLEETIDFKIGGQVINVIQPSLKLVQKFDSAKEKGIEGQAEIIAEIVSNNKNKVKLTTEELLNYPLPVLNGLAIGIRDKLLELNSQKN